MDKELNALRRVAKAAKAYQEHVSEKRTDMVNEVDSRTKTQTGILDIGSAEFELSEALNNWYRTQFRTE